MVNEYVAVRSVVMTGGTSGLGAVAASKILQKPGSRLILGARGPKQNGPDRLSLDLERLDSVREFASAVVDTLERRPIDALVLNAGSIFADTGDRTIDGFEKTFAVNHLAHYLLLRLLSVHLAQKAVVLITTSDVHDPRTNRMSPPDHADAEKLAHPDRFGVDTSARLAGMRAYSASKLCNLMTARAFAQTKRARELDITVIAYNPGLTLNTGLMKNASPAIRTLTGMIFPVLNQFLRFSTPDIAGSALAALTLGDVKPPADRLYASLVRRHLTWPEPSHLARSNEAVQRLWHDSARLVRLPEADSIAQGGLEDTLDISPQLSIPCS